MFSLRHLKSALSRSRTDSLYRQCHLQMSSPGRKAKDGVGCFVFGCLYVFSQTDTDNWLYQHPDLFNHIPALMDELHSYGCKAIQQLGFGAGKAYIMPPFLQDKYDTDPVVKANADVMMASADAGLPNRWTPERKTTYLTKERIQEIIHGIAESPARSSKQSKIAVEMITLYSSDTPWFPRLKISRKESSLRIMNLLRSERPSRSPSRQ